MGLIIRLHTRDKCLCNQQTALVSEYDCVGDKLGKEKVLDADILLAPGVLGCFLQLLVFAMKPAHSWTKPCVGRESQYQPCYQSGSKAPCLVVSESGEAGVNL